MKTFSFNKFLFLSIIIATIISCRYGNDPLWNEITDFFTNPQHTKTEKFNRISTEALSAIIPQPTNDSIDQVISLFVSLEDDHNYKVIRKNDTVYYSFNLGSEIAGGPCFTIIVNDSTWIVHEIIFGK